MVGGGDAGVGAGSCGTDSAGAADGSGGVGEADGITGLKFAARKRSRGPDGVSRTMKPAQESRSRPGPQPDDWAFAGADRAVEAVRSKAMATSDFMTSVSLRQDGVLRGLSVCGVESRRASAGEFVRTFSII